MEWLKNNGDRAALLVISLVAIAASGLMIAKSFSFSDDFTYVHVTGDARERDVPPTGEESVKQSREAIDEDLIWNPPALAGKAAVPIFKSVVLIQKGSQIYDLNKTDGQPLRAPMSNAYLLEYHLDYTRTDVGQLDPDDDGFNNLEEFVGTNGVGTDPTDPKSHPPLTNKLFVKNRIEIPYKIEFTSVSGDLFGVREEKADGKESRLFVRKDQTFFDRFKVVSFREELRFDPRINVERKVGILTVQDLVTGENIELIQRVEANLPSFIGVFMNTLKVDIEIQVRKGDLFRIPGDPRQFRLGEILESEAVIVPCDAKGEPIAGDPKIRIPSLSTRGSAPSTVAPPGTVPPIPPEGERPLRLPPGAPGTTPVAPGTPPAAPGTTPAAPGTTPAAPGTTPAAPGTPPAAPGTIPVAPGTAPVAPGTTPAAPGTAPVAPGTAPAAPGTTPAAPGTTPSAPGTTPAAPGTTPAAPGTTPAAPGTIPAAPGTAPVDPGGVIPPAPGVVAPPTPGTDPTNL